MPAVCPEVMPSVTSGEFYEEVMTFFLPTNFDDPGTGQNVTLNQVVITSITGLPYGMDFILNNSDQSYFPAEGENFGCATICGTPILAGVYEVNISAHIFVEVLGFDLEVDQVFTNTLIVDQGENGNSSFSVDVITGCGTIESTFEALINPDDQPVDWSWDFGNGNSSIDQYPSPQVYSEAGDYTVTLTTELWDYTLNEVNLIDLGGNWYGDIEEPLENFASPDPYFVVKDYLNNIVFSSEVVGNTFSNTWNGLGVILNNPPYTIEFYDEDNISDHDFLGSFPLVIETGYQDFNDGESNGLFVIELESSSVFVDVETIHVFPIPTFDFIVNEDDNTISIFGDSTVTEYVWTINGDVQPVVDSIITMYSGGVYSCAISNTFGCQVYSEEYIHCPEFTPDYDNDIISAPEGFESYQWYYNGLIMEGETSYFIEEPASGNYSVQFTTDYGCISQSDWLVFDQDNTDIEEWTQDDDISMYPNPVTGICFFETNGSFDKITLTSIDGKVIEEFSFINKKQFTIDFSTLKNGLYLVNFLSNDKIFTKKMIKQ